ncbi:MFS transporter, partial [Streptomyces griseorubiginosus]|uniref:MFS transporter n=1 Tax=Streptomyces griseorubiginosus TaxID=67304 RepID=UPI001AD6A452
MTDVLRRGRASLALSFFAQGATFALLVTRIPAIQDRYGVSDALLPAFLAAVPILAGVGSVTTEQLVKRIRPSVLLRCLQPVVMLALVGVGSGDQLAELGIALAAFGLAVGGLDASMNMLGVSLQRSYGRSIMLSFHAAFSLGGIVGASLAWVGAHWHLALWVSYLPVVAVLLPAALIGSRWYVDADPVAVLAEERSQGQSVVFKLLLPLCLVMTFAYIGDSTVSNWSAKYLKDVLGSSEQLSTVPYNVYMVTTLVGRSLGDLGVR